MRLRFDESDRERRLRESLFDFSTEPPRAGCRLLFSLSLSRGSELRRSFSFDLPRTALAAASLFTDDSLFHWAGAGLLLRDRDFVLVLRLVRDLSASLLDDDDELDDELLLLLELERDPEELRDELLSEELKERRNYHKTRREQVVVYMRFRREGGGSLMHSHGNTAPLIDRSNLRRHEKAREAVTPAL